MIPNPFKLNLKVIFYVCVAVVLLAFISAQIFLRRMDKTKQAQVYLETNPNFINQVGSIKGYGFLISHDVSKDSRTSYIGLSVKGSKDDVRVWVYFKKDSLDSWIADRYQIKN